MYFIKSTTKVNNVNVEKAIATSKANATISFNELFKTTKEKTNGLLKTSLGQKTEIYKNSLFDGMDEKKKRQQERK